MRIGILGYGSIGSRHGQNLMGLGHKVIYHDPNVADGLPKDEVIKRSDAVVIASPTSEHMTDITAAAIAGGKPTFCEKPIADGSIGKPPRSLLMVGYNMRFHPCIIKAKEWLNDDRVGIPQWASFICAQYNDRPEYLRDGVTLNWSHEIDLALHLLGEATVAASAVSPKDDISDIILRHKESGCQTSIHLDYLTRPEHRGFSVAGPKGVIIGNLPMRTLLLLDPKGDLKQAEQYPGDINDDYIAEMREFTEIVDRSMSTDLRYGCTAAEAIEVLKICLKVKKGKAT